jgi:6,7-dimethyl-8-ribityllumazine synthase
MWHAAVCPYALSLCCHLKERNMTQGLSQFTADRSRIAFIQASWHADIVGRGRDSFLAEMERLGYPHDVIDVYSVPGAYEIPLHAKRLATSQHYDGIVAGAFVVNGGIYRHDFVASAVIQGMMQVQLETNVPVFSMVLTPHHFHEHESHKSFYLDHFVAKGKEVANACVATLQALKAFSARLLR